MKNDRQTSDLVSAFSSYSVEPEMSNLKGDYNNE
jgi:hypothetical protein